MTSVIRALFLFVVLGFVTPASAGWVCYQPDPVGGMDTWYGSVYYQGGMPNDPSLKVGGWGDIYASAFRFNLSGLPVSATQAAFYLYAFPASGTPAALNWWRPNVNWQEATASLSNPVDQTFYLGSTTAPPTSGWYGIDITSLYNSWRTGSSVYLNYGLKMTPTATNNNFSFFYSSDYTGNTSLRPELCVNSASTESRIVLKWPVATTHAGTSISTKFGDPSLITCSDGTKKQHNGVDYVVSAGTAISASEDGFVKEVLDPSITSGWASNIVIEHDLPNKSGKFTTVSWHVNPTVSVGQFVPKGMQIATVANLATYGHGTHFHFGVRIGSYLAGTSGLGAMPYANHPCDNRPLFPSGFIDHENTANVLFQ